jgi:hypothetical protein
MDPKKLSILDLDSLGAVWVEGHGEACNALQLWFLHNFVISWIYGPFRSTFLNQITIVECLRLRF